METKYILHIGTHKTGTTYIQGFLATNRSRLMDQGIDFPLLGRDEPGAKIHRYLPDYFCGKEHKIPEKCRYVIKGKISEQKYCILSAENFYLCSRHRKIKKIKENISQAKVVCYFRDPVSHVLSEYKQLLKRKKLTMDVSEFLEYQNQQMDNEGFSYYLYDRNAGLWREYYEDTVIVPYRIEDKIELIKGFFNYCGVPLVMDSSFRFAWNRNASISDESSYLLFRLNNMAGDNVISDKTRDSFMKYIVKNDQICRDAIHNGLIWGNVSFNSFIEEFRKRNKVHYKMFGAELGNASRRERKFPVELEYSDRELRELLTTLITA